jgi:hypothetical protein
MVITLEGKKTRRLYLAWKLFESAWKMLVNGTVEIEFRAASETPNVLAQGRAAGLPAERPSGAAG